MAAELVAILSCPGLKLNSGDLWCLGGRGGGRNIKVKKKMAEHWESIPPSAEAGNGEKYGRFLHRFSLLCHLSLSLSPSGKAEEGKQSRAASVGFILLNMSHEWCESDKRIKKLFLGLWQIRESRIWKALTCCTNSTFNVPGTCFWFRRWVRYISLRWYKNHYSVDLKLHLQTSPIKVQL